MYIDGDEALHIDYIKQFINGSPAGAGAQTEGTASTS